MAISSIRIIWYHLCYYMQVRFRLERFEDQRVMHGMYSATHGQYDIPSTILPE